MKFYISILCILFCFSCKPKAPKDAEKQTISNTQDKSILSEEDIETIDYIEYGLSSASKKAVKNWDRFSELETLIATIKKGDLSYFDSDKEIIKTFFLELNTSLPESIASQSITARLEALRTKFHKLRSAAILSNTSKKELLETIKEFLVSASSLNLQINKKLEKDAQDISKFNL